MFNLINRKYLSLSAHMSYRYGKLSNKYTNELYVMRNQLYNKLWQEF